MIRCLELAALVLEGLFWLGIVVLSVFMLISLIMENNRR